MMTTQPGFFPRPMCAHLAYIAIVVPVTVLSACASAGPPGPRGFDGNVRASAFDLEPASYEFSFTAEGIDYERLIFGLISIDEAQVMTVQTDYRALDFEEPCRFDLNDRLESADSEFEVRCGVRLKLRHANGEIVDGTGLARVETNSGVRRVATYGWRGGALRLERLAEPGGALD